MDHYLKIKSKGKKKRKKKRKSLDEDIDCDCSVSTDHYKYIFDDENSSFVSDTSKRLEYPWIKQDREKKKKTKRSKFVQKKKRRKLNSSKNRTIEHYFSPLAQNKRISLPQKPLYTANDYSNIMKLTSSNHDNNNHNINNNNNNNNNHNHNNQNDEYKNNIDLWYLEYGPKTVSDVIGNNHAIQKLKSFLNKWKQNVDALLLSNQSNSAPINIQQNGNNLFGYYSETESNLSRIQYMKIIKQNHYNYNKRMNSNRMNRQKPHHIYPHIKAILLTGPSGSGKTMTINLLAKEFQFDMICYSAIQFTNICANCNNDNLSWSLNLKLKQRLIVIEDADVIISDKRKLKQVITAIKMTKVPIILISNSYKYCKNIKELQKNHSVQCIEFVRPQKEVSLTLLKELSKVSNEMDVQFAENLLNEFSCDIRSCLVLLQFWCDNFERSKANYIASDSTPINPNVLSCILSGKNQKFLEHNISRLWKHKHDEIMDIFESNKRFFNAEIMSRSTIYDCINWYFNCSMLTPLFIFENYLLIQNRNTSNINDLNALSNAALSICDGDILDTFIQKSKNYKLMPMNSVVSCWSVAKVICKTFGGIKFDETYKNRIRFPTFFTNKSKQETNKNHLCNNRKSTVNKLQYLLEDGPYLLLTLLQNINATHTNTKNICGLLKNYGLIHNDMKLMNNKQKKTLNTQHLEWLNNLNCFNQKPILRYTNVNVLKHKFQHFY